MLATVKNIGLIALIGVSWGLTPQDFHSFRPDTHTFRPGPMPDTSLTYLALGDSYTIGESVPAADRYPVQAADLLKVTHIPCLDPEIIATSGWTTGNLLDALGHPTSRSSYELVTLLIGVNNQYQGRSQTEYAAQFSSLLQQAIRLAGNRPSHVIVLSIPDYSVTPFARSGPRNSIALDRIATEIDSFNVLNAGIARSYEVHYLDITAESRKALADASLIAPDGLHFSGKEYGVWATMMAPVMKEALSK